MDDKRDRSLSVASLSSSFSRICNLKEIQEREKRQEREEREKRQERREREENINDMNSKYEFYILRRTCSLITDFDDLLTEYKNETSIDFKYNINDVNMAMTIIKLKNREFRIVKIRRYFTPYVEIISHVMYEEIIINYDKFRIDKIKSILSSDKNSEEALIDIDQICFYDFNKRGIQIIEIF